MLPCLLVSVACSSIEIVLLDIIALLHQFCRRGNCKSTSVGTSRCEIGLRRKTYNVLAGSVLSVWSQVEAVLTHDGNRKGTNSRMQVKTFEAQMLFEGSKTGFIFVQHLRGF